MRFEAMITYFEREAQKNYTQMCDVIEKMNDSVAKGPQYEILAQWLRTANILNQRGRAIAWLDSLTRRYRNGDRTFEEWLSEVMGHAFELKAGKVGDDAEERLLYLQEVLSLSREAQAYSKGTVEA